MFMEYTSIYGYIKIDRNYYETVEFLKNLDKDNEYPFINTNMFSFGDYEIPYFYEDLMLGFAATYKYFGLDLEDWNLFILKFENILRNINFKNAQLHIESAVGDYTLFWRKEGSSLMGEENDKKFIEDFKLFKTTEWYFGFGRRSAYTGYLLQKIEEYEDLRNNEHLNFIYPIPKD
jgi:hypothetical protein